MVETTRKLASVKRITEITPIENAERIECAVVNYGWKVVVKKGEFSVGDLAVYFEIDSWMPYTLVPFLKKEGKTPETYNGVEGERLKTIKLKGQISQGLLLPCSVYGKPVQEDDDLTDELGIQKWEKPEVNEKIPRLNKYPESKDSPFPWFLSKTDQERCQNIAGKLFGTHENTYYTENDTFEVSIKLDGTSFTAYYKDGVFGICSRNLLLFRDEENTYWKIAKEYNLERLLQQYGKNIAIQGEMIGEGIQSNPEKLKGKQLHVFDIFDISTQTYLRPVERMKIWEELKALGANLHHVPIIETSMTLLRCKNVEDLLKYAEGKSLNPQTEREGVVFKHNTKPFSFKAISNKYLLRQK